MNFKIEKRNISIILAQKKVVNYTDMPLTKTGRSLKIMSVISLML